MKLNSDLDRLKYFNPKVFYYSFISSSNEDKNFAYITFKYIFEKQSYFLSVIYDFLSGLNYLFEKGINRHGKKTLSGYLYNQMYELIKNNLHEEDVQNFS